jgi:hypothetical protein
LFIHIVVGGRKAYYKIYRFYKLFSLSNNCDLEVRSWGQGSVVDQTVAHSLFVSCSILSFSNLRKDTNI